MFRFSLFVVLASMACSSDESFELSVELKTDVVPRGEFDRAELRVDGSLRATRVVGEGGFGSGLLEGDRLADLDEAAGQRRVRVTLLQGPATVLEREVLVDLDRDLSVRIVMTRSCQDVVCPDGSRLSCLGGECVDPECVTGTEPSCPDPDCIGPSDCASGASCALPRCESGICLLEGDSAQCEAAQFCDPERGCMALPGEDLDAGMEDAGMDATLDATMDVEPDVEPDVTPPECSVPEDCEPMGECARPSCSGGMCNYTFDDTLCSGTDVCRDGICGPRFDCTPLAGDRDGDGLPDFRDPWPDECNETLLFDDFEDGIDPRLMFRNGSTQEGNEISLPDNGRLHSDAFSDERDVFVEAFFETGDILDTEIWSWGLRMHQIPGAAWVCHIFVNPAAGDTEPRLRHGSRHGEEPYAPAVFPYTDVDLSPGQRYHLQAWVADGTYHCRIVDAIEVRGHTTSVPGAAVPETGGGMQAFTDNVTASVLELRVLRH